MYVLYVIPQYHVFIVYINLITTFILYIISFYSMFYAFGAIMFYCTLLEMTRIKMINQTKTMKCSHTTDQQSCNPTHQQAIYIPNFPPDHTMIWQYYSPKVFSYY